ncbi:MAG: CDP-alcohol phosphatidyltransferase family protein, partial [Planctomycetota bacterium]
PGRENLLRRVRRQRLKYITILPSLVTILNGLCGFTAIVFTAKATSLNPQSFLYSHLPMPYLAMAGYMIILAMIADMLDGRLARMSKSTSSFGGQLDSLCDVISFGLAPAFLMLKVLEYKLAGLAHLNPTLESFFNRFVWLTAAAFISCATIRLARFNVENEEDESAHMSFVGLPTPAAAGVIVSLVLFHQETLHDLPAKSTYAFTICENTIIYMLPFLALGIAVLMVSRIRYPHIINQYIKGKKPFGHFIRILLLLGVIIWNRQAAMVLIFCGFAASGFTRWLYRKATRKNELADLTEQPAVS